jgi:hypothetical protein
LLSLTILATATWNLPSGWATGFAMESFGMVKRTTDALVRFLATFVGLFTGKAFGKRVV